MRNTKQSFSRILVDLDQRGLATVTINRPEARNAWDMETVTELTQAFETLRTSQTLRVVVLTGAGEVFSAGGDLKWMRGVLGRSADEREAEARAIMRLLQTLDAFPQPVIARVNGAAFGGGVGLVCVSDMAIASDRARFGITETRLGIVPGTISPFIVRRIGAAAARAQFLTGSALDPATALRIGLVQQVVEPEALDQSVERAVEAILKCAPGAVARTKRLFREIGEAAPHEAEATGIAAIVEAWTQPEAHDGISAFLEKREPGWRLGGGRASD
ncbi:enoyl-CoA hydratase-related protein [Microbaculum sp. FT89]|uniref:enoyl-CoA hydratase-related protein n=1 Tax=Microbaculum sp. FT89 TaxID=3447298 RepID=UPI003F538767